MRGCLTLLAEAARLEAVDHGHRGRHLAHLCKIGGFAQILVGHCLACVLCDELGTGVMWLCAPSLTHTHTLSLSLSLFVFVGGHASVNIYMYVHVHVDGCACEDGESGVSRGASGPLSAL